MKVHYDADIEWEQADPAHFSGNGQVKRISTMDEAPSIKAYRVEFEPEARTNWHSHTGVQLLYIVEGRCRVQKWGEDVKEAGPGDIVDILPGEKHWHGATPGSKMTHIAVNINAKTTWMEPVSAQEYAV